jgi:hypothetical protein
MNNPFDLDLSGTSPLSPLWQALLAGGNYDAGAQALGLSGISLSGLEAAFGGSLSLGSNGRMYSGSFYGNQYVESFSLGKIAHVGGFALTFASAGLDVYGYSQGDISGTHLSANLSMGGAGLIFPIGTALSAGYFGIDTYYPTQNKADGGFVQFIHDAPVIYNKVNNAVNASENNNGSF